MQPQLQFSNTESLINWLKLTVAGKNILDSLLPDWMLTQTAILEAEIRAEVDRRLARRARCLIVCHADGAIEVYGDEVSVNFADMLDVDGPDATTEAETYMAMHLPDRARKLLLERSTMHYPEHRTPEQERQRRFEVACLRSIPRLKEQEEERLANEAERREKIAREKYPECVQAPF